MRITVENHINVEVNI